MFYVRNKSLGLVVISERPLVASFFSIDPLLVSIFTVSFFINFYSESCRNFLLMLSRYQLMFFFIGN